MSASHSPDISDIHHPTTVAETLSVTTEPGPLQGAVNGAEPVPSVGASISVSGESSHGGGALGDRSSTSLLSLASSTLNLTDILSAQQQALEQFQCQLQLAQQTEAINQRLDAIERTLNSLIQQKAQEEAVKKQQAAAAAVVLPPSAGVRPSQQVQLASPPDTDLESKKKKLPRELCVRLFLLFPSYSSLSCCLPLLPALLFSCPQSKVRSTYHSLNLDFKIDER